MEIVKIVFPISLFMDYVDVHNVSWLSIFAKFCLRNRPCLVTSSVTNEWNALEWINNGVPNYEYLTSKYGLEQCPIAIENKCDIGTIQLKEYLKLCQDDSDPDEEDHDIYLKDWHFQQRFGDGMYNPPLFVAPDWVNREKWSDDAQNPFNGDYRFVYIGRRGTTRFHSDVMSSHSWSANLCGRKRWYFVPPGNERMFIKNGNLIEDIREMRDIWTEAGVFEQIQNEGELMFVPSNWHHQVHNLDVTVSINHNFINASNVHSVWEFLQKRLKDVKNELIGVEGFTKEELEEQFQIVLGADARLNMPRLRELLKLVINSRNGSEGSSCCVCPLHLDLRNCFSNESCLERISSICDCTHRTQCEKCTTFMNSFELTIACQLLDDMHHWEFEN